MKIVKQILVILFIAISMFSCKTEEKYSPLNIYSEAKIDSIKLELVTIMGRRPNNVDKETSRSPEFLQYYIDLSGKYDLLYLTGQNDTNFFYMIRPARNHAGNVNRAVGGYYLIVEDDSITDFTEVFNTTIMPVEELKLKGLELFESMVRNGDIDEYFQDRQLIEWPSSRSVYDKTINEWVYIND
jgi:hypothetical protein